MCMERERLNRPDLSHRRDTANCIQLMEIYEETFHGNHKSGNISKGMWIWVDYLMLWINIAMNHTNLFVSIHLIL